MLIGIGVSAITGAGTTFMLILSPFYTATQAYIWLTGSIYGATWTDIKTILPVVVIVVPLAIWLARSLNAQEFGDDLATGLGVRCSGTGLRCCYAVYCLRELPCR